MCAPDLDRTFFRLWLVIGVLMVAVLVAAAYLVKLWKSR